MRDSAQVLLRLGRQEKSFGASRLVGLRDGPNLRRAFDLGSLVFQRGMSSLYLPGSFIQASGDAETTFFIAPTLDFTF